jgi:hypothetical protein
MIKELPHRKIPVDIKTQTDQTIVTSCCGLLEPETSRQADPTTFADIIKHRTTMGPDKIMLLVEEQELMQMLENPARFEIASDGGFDPISGISSHGWVVAINRVLIAKG